MAGRPCLIYRKKRAKVKALPTRKRSSETAGERVSVCALTAYHGRLGSAHSEDTHRKRRVTSPPETVQALRQSVYR